jgi:hypothetical protein
MFPLWSIFTCQTARPTRKRLPNNQSRYSVINPDLVLIMAHLTAFFASLGVSRPIKSPCRSGEPRSSSLVEDPWSVYRPLTSSDLQRILNSCAFSRLVLLKTPQDLDLRALSRNIPSPLFLFSPCYWPILLRRPSTPDIPPPPNFSSFPAFGSHLRLSPACLTAYARNSVPTPRSGRASASRAFRRPRR